MYHPRIRNHASLKTGERRYEEGLNRITPWEKVQAYVHELCRHEIVCDGLTSRCTFWLR